MADHILGFNLLLLFLAGANPSITNAALTPGSAVSKYEMYQEEVHERVAPSEIRDIQSSDPVAVSDSASCIITFRRAGNLILIKARADTTNGNFILDTGAPGLVLNITYFRNYISASAVAGGGITGSIPMIARGTVNHLSFNSINYYNVQADLVNLGHIEDTRGIKIFGLLGVNLFKRFEMIIDYDMGLIYLHLIGRKEENTYQSEMLSDTLNYHMMPIDIQENKIITRGEVAGKRLNFIVDTGAESNVLDSRLPNKVFDNVTVTRHTTLSGSGNQKVDALYGNLKNLKIGIQTFGSTPVLITNLEQMCIAYDYCIDGMLGFDFLSQSRIGFNFIKRQMYLWK